MTYLDGVNESVTNGDGDSPHISANALTGITNFRSYEDYRLQKQKTITHPYR